MDWYRRYLSDGFFCQEVIGLRWHAQMKAADAGVHDRNIYSEKWENGK